MSIQSLFIEGISTEYTIEYIAQVLYNKHIAKVSGITLKPYKKGTNIYNSAYVEIAEWFTGDFAEKFIQTLEYNGSDGVYINHTINRWWKVLVNTNEMNIQIIQSFSDIKLTISQAKNRLCKLYEFLYTEDINVEGFNTLDICEEIDLLECQLSKYNMTESSIMPPVVCLHPQRFKMSPLCQI